MKSSRQLLLSDTVNGYVSDYDLSGSKSGVTHQILTHLPSQILKLLWNSIRQLGFTSEIPSTWKDIQVFFSTNVDDSICNVIINSLGSIQLLYSDIFIMCIFALTWLKVFFPVHYISYPNAKLGPMPVFILSVLKVKFYTWKEKIIKRMYHWQTWTELWGMFFIVL